MKIRLKDETVNLDGLGLPMLIALWWAGIEYKKQGLEAITVTSARDGEHMPDSLHDIGLAVDLRIWGLPHPRSVADNLARNLGDEFDVLLEPTHLHIEFDPGNKP